MSRIRCFFLTMAASALIGAAKPEPLVYTLSPELKDGALQALDVSLKMRAGPDGRVRLDLPGAGGGAVELWRYLQDFKVEGARSVSAPSPAERLVEAAPGAALTVSYRIVSAFDHDPDIKELETYKPLIRPGRFWIYGEAAFAVPKTDRTAVFHWTGAPQGFGFASDLEHAAGKPMRLDQLQESVSVGGPDLTVYRRDLGGAPLRVAILSGFDMKADAFVEMAAKVVAGERAFWGGREGPFLVALAPLKRVPNSLSIRGEGRGDAFAIQAGDNVALENLKEILAHEYFHTWNPARLGGIHDGDAERADYWFSEGFTDFYARRLALRMGVFSLEAFVAEWNDMLRAYAASSVRAAPNSRVVADFWNNREVEKLPYQRGALLAATWDRELRARSQGKVGLDDVVRALRARAAAAHGPGEKAPELFALTARRYGLDVSGDVRRVVEQGGPALLPADAFGGCLKVATRQVPVFERGFELEQKDGVSRVVRVKPDSPAFAAGLRDGMTFVRRESGLPGDSTQPYGARVLEDGQPRLITFLPAGKGQETLQQIELPKDLTPQARAACVKAVAGAR